MKASRSDYSRRIDWSAVKGDPLTEACLTEKIRCCMRSIGSNRRANGAYEYAINEDRR